MGAGTCGTARPFIYYPCYFDCHIHIQSGNCTPLPIMWIKVSGMTTIKPDREAVNIFSQLALGAGGDTLKSSTAKIADKAIASLNHFLELRKEDKALFCYKDLYTGSSIPPLAMLFAMTMDMEYAHIAGYEGQTIYHLDEIKKQYFYYYRYYGMAKESEGKKCFLSVKERRVFEKWDKQVLDTKSAAIKYPFRLMPLYHYDPRRWNYSSREDISSGKLMQASPSALEPKPYTQGKLEKGTWNFPFTEIASRKEKNRPGLFIGFKMYTTQGYMPLDDKCGCLHSYYSKCVEQQIPIVSHCSPGGNIIPEMKFYMEYLTGQRQQKTGDTDNTYVSIDTIKFFINNYVHPKSWRKVLEKYPKLRLNLAHFGGDDWEMGDKESDFIKELKLLMDDFPEVYTDISCFDLKKNKKKFSEFLRTYEYSLKYSNRILFGTDWYMTLLVLTKVNLTGLEDYGLLKGKDYSTFSLEIKKMLDAIDFRIWIRFTILNPVKFYGLDNPVLLDNLAEGMKKEVKQRAKISGTYYFNKKNEILNKIISGRDFTGNVMKSLDKLRKICGE